MTETFDAVLADLCERGEILSRASVSRLAAAHASEVGERDAELAACDRNLRDAMNTIAAADKCVEAAERDARQAVGLLREVADEQIEPPQTESLIARIDAFLAAIDAAIATTEQAGT